MGLFAAELDGFFQSRGIQQSHATVLQHLTQREGIAADAQSLYAADGTDRITAWAAATGEVLWTSDAYRYRSLSTPFSLGPAIVFGDYEGYLHFLSADRGVAQLRLETDGSPMAAPPALSGTTVLVVTRDGGLFGLRPE